MLTSTFLHIPRISEKTEKFLWDNSINDWDAFLENEEKIALTKNKKAHINRFVRLSKEYYSKRNIGFFSETVPSNMHWRGYPDLKDKCCFLDIETTGLSKHRNKVTTIGMYDGNESKVLINGKDLHTFPDEIKKYSMIVTFNGKCFDLPFLEAYFPGLKFDHMHVDLRFLMRRFGYSGGLKLIEKQIGIIRDDDLQDVDGYEAVRLWHKYERGDEDALRLLVKYNIADVLNLKILMDMAFKMAQKDAYSNIRKQ